MFAVVSDSTGLTGGPLGTAFINKFQRREWFELGTHASDLELTRIRDDVLVPLLNSHNNYPPTMLPSIPKSSRN